MGLPPLQLKDGGRITESDLPANTEEFVGLSVDFPSLSEAETQRYRTFEREVVNYVRLEGELIKQRNLRFLRSALLNNWKYWIWEFMTPDGDRCYATVSERGGGELDSLYDDSRGLSPEQFLVAVYFQCL